MRASLVLTLLIAVTAVSVPGCHRLSSGRWVSVDQTHVDALPNPLPVPLVPRELVMDEVSDEVDNYFRILREQRLRLSDNVLMEGWIETEPKIGSTALEPWRQDSTRGFELAHATLQSVRRWCKVRVIPTGDRYLIDVQVYKELEDLLQTIQIGHPGADISSRQLSGCRSRSTGPGRPQQRLDSSRS